MPSAPFPVDAILPALRQTLGGHSRALLQAPPGAGKTTRVPPALLDEDWLGGQRILMLEPRRIAARSAAGFMAQQFGEPVGDTVGYRIRYENRVSARTRIEVVTEGILTRMIQDDPGLDGVGLLIFDEFHERHLHADLGLAMALDVQQALRPELRIVLMSATLDGTALSRFLDAPLLSSEGRSFPVDIVYQPSRRDESLTAQLRRALSQVLADIDGDVLVFLPGRREIDQALRALPDSLPEHIDLLPLHGELSVDAQAAVMLPAAAGRRRVVLASNVAESALTLPGVRAVIDSGLAREPRFDPNSGFSRLETVAIAEASAEQRAGRAGRVAAGLSIRLWSADQRRDPQRRAEILQVDLSGLALELAAWGAADLRFVDPPPAGSLAAARDLLRRLEALDDAGRITHFGRRLLQLGTAPRLAALLLSADSHAAASACDLAALLDARDPLSARSDDLMPRVHALHAFRQRRAHAGHDKALAAIDRAATQWRKRLRVDAARQDVDSAQQLGLLLAHAFPDRIARQLGNDPLRYALSGGRSARLHPHSDLLGQRWLAVAELRHERGDALIQSALALSESDLRQCWPQRFTETDHAVWDDVRGMLLARYEQRFDAIVLDVREGGRIAPDDAAQALTTAVVEAGLQRLAWDDASQQWLERLRCLAEWMPELALPDFSDVALLAGARHWLHPAFRGRRRLSELGTDALCQALATWVDHAAATDSRIDPQWRRRVDDWAPKSLRVPSGLQVPIRYEYGAAPVLAVKLQAVFGWATTPRIADGRVPLTLHLLSPAGRPLQITSDLAHFWNHGYAEVRRDMRGRYPKHPWPDDPWRAEASHRAKPRKT